MILYVLCDYHRNNRIIGYTSSVVKILKNDVSNYVRCHRISLDLSLWFGGKTFLSILNFSGTI
jgi:hypothetical protein